MNLEQIVKETVAKIVAEKKGKDLTGDGKIDSADYLQARSNAIEKAKMKNEGENEDHEVSMAQRSLNSIIRSAMELKAKIGNQEINIPAWIQDHITNSENFIDQASQGYHEYHNDGEHEEMDEARFEKGEDVGGKGFEFKKIAAKAAKQYGSKEAGQRVAGAIMKKVLNKEGEGYNFEKSAVESASGDTIGTIEYDDMDLPIFFSAADDTISYHLGYGGEFEGKIYKYDGKTGKSIEIGDLKYYGDGQNHPADDDMHESQEITSDELAQLQATADDTSKMPAERDAARNKIYASRAKKESQELNEDNLELKSIAKNIYSVLKQNGVNAKLIASIPRTGYAGKSIGATLTGGSNEALVYYWDDTKTKLTTIEIYLSGAKEEVIDFEKKILSSFPSLEQYSRQEFLTPQAFKLVFRLKEKTTAKGGIQELDEWTVRRWQHYAGIK